MDMDMDTDTGGIRFLRYINIFVLAEPDRLGREGRGATGLATVLRVRDVVLTLLVELLSLAMGVCLALCIHTYGLSHLPTCFVCLVVCFACL
ncbi:hypothetical protein P170DRAFT_41683 [Aspergillus steynii IBT 23096]|uniref:Uncharacterized protein n=1 Tax=Aspergillus steynii IBT 23096 TaxID=1392250 RepID=A0A2I2GRF3_9EURO|nr:uncharacterized protein P170DRAFT_41683 [Aspergillus steynii IBT 23096]PLB55457.1 hypothetical protein P170DRAFT_41683 [Aspergillus steynii IBT 23096]